MNFHLPAISESGSPPVAAANRLAALVGGKLRLPSRTLACLWPASGLPWCGAHYTAAAISAPGYVSRACVGGAKALTTCCVNAAAAHARLIVWCLLFGEPRGFAGGLKCRYQVEPATASLRAAEGGTSADPAKMARRYGPETPVPER